MSYKPTLILHGGAGAIDRSHLPPSLYSQYHASLLRYLRSTKSLLSSGSSALDAAVHAVSCMEDDELFNCGRGSVFTLAGTIEMEASIMVTSVVPPATPASSRPPAPGFSSIKRGVGVMGLRNVRHPIQLARECLVRTGDDGDGGSMHAQLCAPVVEHKAREWGLEMMPDGWFWTRRRWEEHLRGLEGGSSLRDEEAVVGDGDLLLRDLLPSQGTVGCVCLDAWGGLAVATSTGGLTNKWPGRIGDTPTLGAGFWAEAWEEEEVDDGDVYGNGRMMGYRSMSPTTATTTPESRKSLWDLTVGDCVGSLLGREESPYAMIHHHPQSPRKRAVAVSGTGNGDSFLRVAAARTACAMRRFSPRVSSLAEAVTAIAGRDGELQRSAGSRWGVTGEGQGGMIGIEAELDTSSTPGDSCEKKQLRRGKVVYDFNCGGMWRAWIEEDGDGEEIERVMVFREEYFPR
ncbi:hypothetical protein FE257_008434 [Aspergillus nanangensis]|uniref:N-terminal nucleophile aminohydrolase n=1 Tax=Aspergillus nanangensis TaxID=2582783 RepID=A0AAD4CLK5_ASPNN|nr:hypothetical protein FE257_008434 [Aspergillus nanangensis]